VPPSCCFFRKHYLNRDFPLNRFQAADWPAWLASARWQPIDDIGHRGMSITIPQNNGEFAFDMPAALVKQHAAAAVVGYPHAAKRYRQHHAAILPPPRRAA
jgi:hypothetical protein